MNENKKEIEKIINENLNKLNEKKYYNIDYNIIKDILYYIEINKKNKILFKNIDIYNIYNNDNEKFNNYLYEKYNFKLCLNIIKNNDIEFIINENLSINENEKLYNELIKIKLKDIEKFIFKIFDYIIFYIIDSNINNLNNYDNFLYDLNYYIENDLKNYLNEK